MRFASEHGSDSVLLNLAFRGSAAVGLALVLLVSGGFRELAGLPVRVYIIGVLGSGIFFLSGFAAIRSVALGPLNVSWIVLRSSAVLPVLASVLLWREFAAYQRASAVWLDVAGVVLTLTGLLLVGLGRRQVRDADRRPVHRRWPVWLVVSFLAQGGWNIVVRATGEFDADTARLAFLLLAFSGSAALTVPIAAARRHRMSRRELLFGGALGLCSVLGTGSRMLALKWLPGVVVFPVTTAMVMVLVQLASAVVWKERLGSLGIAGIVSAIAALVLMNIP
jgi:drug/metabolite transporter (DMT)-like permease